MQQEQRATQQKQQEQTVAQLMAVLRLESFVPSLAVYSICGRLSDLGIGTISQGL